MFNAQKSDTEVYKLYIDKKKKLRSDRIGIGDTHNFLDRIGSEKMVSLHPGPSLADAGPGARYGVGPPSVRLQWRYGGGGSIPFVAGPGATAPVAPPKGWP